MKHRGKMKTQTKQQLRDEIVTLTMRNKTLEINLKNSQEDYRNCKIRNTLIEQAPVALIEHEAKKSYDYGYKRGFSEKTDELVNSIRVWKKRAFYGEVAAYALLATLLVIVVMEFGI